ncbi:MAG: triose-phosphate isomerase [Alphaproteobacteria bacterium]|nr:triose-phosphate isomerase [Alphaproteobacteria bacterium]
MKFIIGNWKMNGNLAEKEAMFKALKNVKTNNKVIICLPFTLLYDNKYKTIIGAQDISQYSNGAYTGDISGEMLKDAGAEYVIVGHSERRFYHNETNDIVKAKAVVAIKNNLIPIICVGETDEEHHAGRTMSVVKKMVLESVPDDGEYIIAYEPRWAIGKGITPTPEEITAVHETIFKTLHSIHKEKTPILYGGSVKSDNASEISELPHVDGLLIGGASLKPETFLPIINSVK